MATLHSNCKKVLILNKKAGLISLYFPTAHTKKESKKYRLKSTFFRLLVSSYLANPHTITLEPFNYTSVGFCQLPCKSLHLRLTFKPFYDTSMGFCYLPCKKYDMSMGYCLLPCKNPTPLPLNLSMILVLVSVSYLANPPPPACPPACVLLSPEPNTPPPPPAPAV